jgi:histidyl-tRNA synthetase
LGEDEVEKKVIGVKTMATGEQDTIAWDSLAAYLKQ